VITSANLFILLANKLGNPAVDLSQQIQTWRGDDYNMLHFFYLSGFSSALKLQLIILNYLMITSANLFSLFPTTLDNLAVSQLIQTWRGDNDNMQSIFFKFVSIRFFLCSEITSNCFYLLNTKPNKLLTKCLQSHKQICLQVF